MGMKTINRALASGVEYVPSHPCIGSAPFCDLGVATEGPTPPSIVEDCTENGQRLPDPTDCHIYYRCSDPDQDGVFDIDEYSCGDFIFDPNQLTCSTQTSLAMITSALHECMLSVTQFK